MGSPSVQMASGGVVGTGAKIEVRGLGFTPKRVEVYNITSGDKGTWIDSFIDGEVYKELAAGTGALVTTVANGIAPQADGFDIGVDADINASAEHIKWMAWG